MADRPADTDAPNEPGAGVSNGTRVTPRSATSGSGWGMQNWRLRTKVMAVVIVPTLTALILGGLRAYDDLDQAVAFRQTVSQVQVAGKITNLVQELQKERTLAVAWVASGKEIPRTELDTQIGIVDKAVKSARAATKKLDTGDSAADQRYRVGLQRLTVLDAIRVTPERTNYPDIGVYSAYSSVIEDIVRLGREVNVSLTNRSLLDEGTVIQSLSDAKENIAKENAILQIAAFRKEFPADLLSQLRDAQASAAGALANYKANASIEQLQLYSDTVSGPEVDQRERIMARAIAGATATTLDNPGDKNANGQTSNTQTANQIPPVGQKKDKKPAKVSLGIDRTDLTTSGSSTLVHLRAVETKLLDNMRDRANDLAAAATRSAVQDALIVLTVLLLALALMALVTRSLLVPLRKLRREALEVAHQRLPETVKRILGNPDPAEAAKNAVEPIAVFTKEETGQVARSFDVVQEQAVRMAAEQALLRDNINSIFVNLSRRSQGLVERQLSLIDGLEADEQDPDQLSSLFELDHLATRMRRNSESLLVLSGAGLSRQFNRSVPASEVVGAAVSEVEQYARIEVAQVPDVYVQGRVASDLVHLIAELLDNATFFSEPEKKVRIRVAITRGKELGIQITDQGVGMAQDDIAVANERLADPPDLDVAVTKRMGLYVVARLAKRHDIHVRLRENEDIDGGLIARITVPSDLVHPLYKPSPTPAAPAPAFTATPNGRATPQAIAAGPGDDTVAGATLFGAALPGSGLPASAPANGTGTGNHLPSPGTGVELTSGAPPDRLPIYEAVSKWFEKGSTEVPRPAEAAAQSDTPVDTPVDTPAEANGNGNGLADSDDEQGELPQQSTWQSPGDEGWLTAQSLLGGGSQHVTTTAGLPKRVPRAYLVPGSAKPDPAEQQATESQPAGHAPSSRSRSADVVRGRMSRFQEGMRRGRHAVIGAQAGEPPGPEQSPDQATTDESPQDEEQE